MFIILKGDVGVYADYRLQGADMTRMLGAGDFFADSGLLQDKRAAFTTVALTEAIVMPIERNIFHEFVQKEPSLAFEIIKDLYLKLEQAGKSSRDLIVQTVKEPVGAASAATATPGTSFRLFPEEHGDYQLLLNANDTEHLMKKSHVCPVCKGNFEALAIRPSKLVMASTDADMRTRYKDIEPLYYEVLTCPYCLYSALPDVFDSPDKSKQDIMRELEAIKGAVMIRQDADKDTDSVFSGFYLALHCAPLCFSKHQLVSGKLLYKLSRVYQDAGDENMEIQATRQALENYLYAYENIGIPPAQEQQICILIGELYLKLGDLKNAVAFFFKAKTSGSSTPVLKNHADNRVYDIREMAASGR
jgi:uncharacterized protein (DUF2225 family)